jgi:hypothetical protein
LTLFDATSFGHDRDRDQPCLPKARETGVA